MNDEKIEIKQTARGTSQHYINKTRKKEEMAEPLGEFFDRLKDSLPKYRIHIKNQSGYIAISFSKR